MRTSTLEHAQTTTIAPAEALSTSEENSLITLASMSERPAKAKAFNVPRAWSFGGNVD